MNIISSNADGKWAIRKCRRVGHWHVDGPNISADEDFPVREEAEFGTFTAAVEFVRSRLDRPGVVQEAEERQ